MHKPGRMQDLYNFYLDDGHIEILNMLNVKYIHGQWQGRKCFAQKTLYNGPAWFVEKCTAC